MKTLGRYPALQWLRDLGEAERSVRDRWAEIEIPATNHLLQLVNMGDSKEEIQAFRESLSSLYEITRESDAVILTLRNQVREFWGILAQERNHLGPTGTYGDSSRAYVLLNKWWKHYPLDSEGYWPNWETGRFLPTQRNFHGVVARILVGKARYLSTCPNCNRFFIKLRDDSKYCLSRECRKRANTERQKEFQIRQREKTITAHKSRKRA